MVTKTHGEEPGKVTPKEKAAGQTAAKSGVSKTYGDSTSQRIELAITATEARVDSRLLARAMQGAKDHRDGYARFKQALEALTGVLALGTST